MSRSVRLSVGDWNQESWRLQVEQCITQIAKVRNPLFLEGLNHFFGPTCIVGGLAGRGSVAVEVGVGDR